MALVIGKGDSWPDGILEHRGYAMDSCGVK